MSENNNLYCVIGSGPAGLAAAHALVQNKRRVLMLDTGLELEPRIAARIANLAAKEPDAWTEEEKDELRGSVNASVKGIEQKRLFGSDFANRSPEIFRVEFRNSQSYVSFAQGGLANIWGCALLPMRQQDMVDWPFPLAELEEHYRAVLGFMPLATRGEALQQLFPLYCASPSIHQLSRQAELLLGRMECHREDLEKTGIYFGASRIAASMEQDKGIRDCRYCGLCLSGCPYGIPYNGKTTLKQLKRCSNFTYRPGIVVQRLREENGKVCVEASDLNAHPMEPIFVDRTLLAAGSIGSTRIILKSLGVYEKPVKMACSDFFYLPALSLHGSKRVTYESLHTMPQIFLELLRPDVCEHGVHFQVYTYNAYFEQALRSSAGPASVVAGPLIEAVLNRLFVLFGYLHSNCSSHLMLTLGHDPDETLTIKGVRNLVAKRHVKKAVTALKRVSPKTLLFPISSAITIHPPGSSVHCGCTFPMRNAPDIMETDVLGRLGTLKHVHIVDASVFPNITSSTITLTIMANAHRIACKIMQL